MIQIQRFLQTHERPSLSKKEDFDKFLRRTQRFFLVDDRLWKYDITGHHRLYLAPHQRFSILRATHDDLGHKGFYSTRRILTDRFWWPSLASDVKQFLNSCHQCQLRQTMKVIIPPTVALPAPLFRKVYVDTMVMPLASGFRYITQARCSLSA